MHGARHECDHQSYTHCKLASRAETSTPMMKTVVLGTGSYLPPTVLTSTELGDRLGTGGQWIVDKTHIRERRVADGSEATSDLATAAARRALQSSGTSPDELDLVIVATSTPDQPIPATAALVQANISADRAAAFDVDAVCSGFVYALVVAHGMLLADDSCRKALVIGADIYSRILDYDDRRTAVLFGDGAGAVVLGKTNADRGIHTTLLGCDGKRADLVQVPAGGSRRPASPQTLADGLHYFKMIGRPVRELAGQVMPEVVEQLLKRAGLTLDDVQHLVPHQANGVMLAELDSALGLAPGVMCRTVEHFGNTGAASVPITLDHAVRGGQIGEDDRVVLVTFGGGMSWGGALLTWAYTHGEETSHD
ncbi:beta-ketoacyl-ACP synthase III [Amycolatopsis sp. NPDC006125]|uniref:3-oxoacyl-ACP synthase III family protein n=1 Tax=Amycolatopsis sp. NPDC006125 TaxID=3156730 RepID=UPI0033A01C7D